MKETLKKLGSFFCLMGACLFMASCVNPSSVDDPTAENPGETGTSYTVTFDGNAGTDTLANLPSPLTGIATGGKITEPEETPERAEYQFAGWYLEATCEMPWQFGLNTVNKDLSLYAKWVSAADTLCTITFDTGASGLAITPIKVAAGTTIDLDAIYDRVCGAYHMTDPDYESEGLYREATYTNWLMYSVLRSFPVTENVILYARFFPRYLITLYGNGGTFPDGLTSVSFKDSSVMEQTVHEIIDGFELVNDGKLLSGWSTDVGGTKRFDTNVQLAGPLTLYAQWAVIDSILDGFWTSCTNGHDYSFIKLDSATGTGVGYDGYLNGLTFSDCTISLSQGTSPYSYSAENDTITVHTTNGDRIYSRPSVAQIPGGSLDAGQYYHNCLIADLAEDGSVTGFCTETKTEFLSGCKWSNDTDFFYLLDGYAKVIAGFPLHSTFKATTAGLGDSWYGFAGTAANGFYDAWSVNFKSDGTWVVPVWGQEITGHWFLCKESDTTGFIVTHSDTDGYYEKIDYTIIDGAYSFMLDVEVQSPASSPSAFNSPASVDDENLFGSWKLETNAYDVIYTFNRDGTVTLFMTGAGHDSTRVEKFAVKNGLLHMINLELYELMCGIDSNPYAISGDTLSFYGYVFARQ